MSKTRIESIDAGSKSALLIECDSLLMKLYQLLPAADALMLALSQPKSADAGDWQSLKLNAKKLGFKPGTDFHRVAEEKRSPDKLATLKRSYPANAVRLCYEAVRIIYVSLQDDEERLSLGKALKKAKRFLRSLGYLEGLHFPYIIDNETYRLSQCITHALTRLLTLHRVHLEPSVMALIQGYKEDQEARQAPFRQAALKQLKQLLTQLKTRIEHAQSSQDAPALLQVRRDALSVCHDLRVDLHDYRDIFQLDELTGGFTHLGYTQNPHLVQDFFYQVISEENIPLIEAYLAASLPNKTINKGLSQALDKEYVKSSSCLMTHLLMAKGLDFFSANALLKSIYQTHDQAGRMIERLSTFSLNLPLASILVYYRIFSETGCDVAYLSQYCERYFLATLDGEYNDEFDVYKNQLEELHQVFQHLGVAEFHQLIYTLFEKANTEPFATCYYLLCQAGMLAALGHADGINTGIYLGVVLDFFQKALAKNKVHLDELVSLLAMMLAFVSTPNERDQLARESIKTLCPDAKDHQDTLDDINHRITAWQESKAGLQVATFYAYYQRSLPDTQSKPKHQPGFFSRMPALEKLEECAEASHSSSFGLRGLF